MIGSKTSDIESTVPDENHCTSGASATVVEDFSPRETASSSEVQAEAAELDSKVDGDTQRPPSSVVAQDDEGSVQSKRLEPYYNAEDVEADCEDPRYSIQPLPLVSNTSHRPGPRGEPGAHAVRTFRPPNHPTTSAPDDQASINENRDDVDHGLIHAQLVEQGDDKGSDLVVMAEEVPPRRGWLALLLLVMTLAVSVPVVGWILLRDQTTSTESQTTEVKKGKHEDGCFQSVEDLYSAIDAFVLFNATNHNFSDVGRQNTESLSWGPMETWCVSNLQRLAHAFFDERLRDTSLGNATIADVISKRMTTFVHDLGEWDVSNAEDMTELFRGNQKMTSEWGIQHWNTSKVIRLTAAFSETQWPDDEDSLDLSNWDISSVLDLGQLFQDSDVEKAGLAHWDTRNVVSMYSLANRAPRFNEDIGGWNTAKFMGLRKAFNEAPSFNQDLSRWDVGSMTNMNNAFRKATKFDSPMSSWDVSRVQGMMSIFGQASSFNQDISGWNVSLVTDLRWAFNFASSFNQNLCSWGKLLPKNASIKQVFHGTDCPNWSDPILSEGGPFCYNCDGS